MTNFLDKAWDIIGEINGGLKKEMRVEKGTMPLNKQKKLEIETDEADIICYTKKDEESITVELITYEEGPELRTSTNQHQVSISAVKSTHSLRLLGSHSSVQLKVYLPEYLFEDIVMKATSGVIQFANLHANTYHCTASSGGMNISDIQGKAMYFKTTSGKMNVKNLNAEQIDVHGSSGKYLLKNIVGDLDIRLTSGKIEADNLSGNTLNFKVSSGKMKIKNVECNQLKVTGASGEVDIQNTKAEQADVEVTSGKIDMAMVEGQLNVKTSSGKINYKMNALYNDTKLKSSSGVISVQLNKDPNVQVKANSSSGSIDINRELKHATVLSKTKIEGELGEGASLLDISTSSGKITIY